MIFVTTLPITSRSIVIHCVCLLVSSLVSSLTFGHWPEVGQVNLSRSYLWGTGHTCGWVGCGALPVHHANLGHVNAVHIAMQCLTEVEVQLLFLVTFAAPFVICIAGIVKA